MKRFKKVQKTIKLNFFLAQHDHSHGDGHDHSHEYTHEPSIRPNLKLVTEAIFNMTTIR